MDPRDLEQLVTRAMPFGKYKGRLIADLPGNYLNWFARAGFPPGETGQLLALMQEINHNGLLPLLAPLRQKVATAASETPTAPGSDPPSAADPASTPGRLG